MGFGETTTALGYGSGDGEFDFELIHGADVTPLRLTWVYVHTFRAPREKLDYFETLDGTLPDGYRDLLAAGLYLRLTDRTPAHQPPAPPPPAAPSPAPR